MSAPGEAGPTRPSPRTRGFALFSALALLCLLFSALPSFAQSVVTTLTGINGPTFVAIDANRTIGGTTATWLYVSEHGATNNTGGGRILRYNLTSGSTTPTNIGGGNFTSPDAILVDAAGNLWIADRAQDHIVHLSNTGTVLSSFGSGTAGAADEMHGPVALATDSAGNFYIAEHGETLTPSVGAGGNYISKYTSAGTRVWRVGGTGNGNGQFANTGPYGIAVTGSTVVVSDGFNSRVQTFDLNGTYQSQFALPGALPLGVYLDASGALWIAEATNSGDGSGAIQQVQKYSVGGVYGGVTLTNSMLLPFDTVINPATNYAYVSDYGHNQVVVFDLNAPVGGSAPVINSSPTASGTVGASFTYNVTATNSPTSFATVDALPAGLSLNTTTGAITGTPSTAGTTTTHLTATNASGTSAQFALTIAISAATPSTPVGPTITSFDLDTSSVVQGVHADMIVTFDTAVTGVDATDFAVNTQGSATASITGVDPISTSQYRVHFNYTDANGSIQVAIKTSGTGIVDGSSQAFRGNGITATPVYGTGTTAASDTTAPTALSVTAGAPVGSTVNFTVTFSEPVTGVDAADFFVSGVGGTVGTVTGSGTTYTVPVTASGNGTVTLTVVGGASANIRDAASNWFGGNGTTSGSVSVGSSTPAAPVISSATTTNATVGTAFNYQIVASNSPTSYAATGLAGTGLSLNTSTGAISGTPTAAGTITSQLTATNSTGTSPAVTLTITVAASSGGGSAPVISSATTANATVGSAFTYQITANNSPTSYAATGLAGTGLSLNTSTGVISGTPTAAGTITSQLTATNSTGTSPAVTLTITVAASSGGGSAPVISSATTANATVGSAFTYQITASNSPTSYAATGLAGSGLSLNTSTGVISGTPTAAGTISSQLTATNSTGTSAPVTLTINVGSITVAVPTINSSTVASVNAGSAFSYQITATNSPTSYAATGLTGTGLSLNTSTGVISGTPTAAGTINAQLTASNSGGTSAPVTLKITVNPAGPVPVITSATSATATTGAPFTYQITATNSPTSYFAGPLVGTGLSLNSVTGVISGTPTMSGKLSLQLTATNAYGTSSPSALVITIGGQSGKSSQTVTFLTPVSNIFVGDTILLSAASSSGLPLTFTVVSGDATLSGSTLVINSTTPVIIRASQAGNATYSSASTDATFVAVQHAQSLNLASIPLATHTDGKLTLSATSSSGLPITYSIVSGPATISGNTVTFTGSGAVVIRATQAGNNMYASTSSDLTIAANPVPRLVNISTRAKVTANDSGGATIAGFYVTGTSPKQMLIRAVGPGLTGFGVSNALENPTLKLYDSKGVLVATNTSWNNDAQIAAAGDAVGAFKLAASSKDSAILATLAPGSYTAQVQSTTSNGAVLIEVYDVSSNAAVPTKQLVNLSTRGAVGTGDDALFGGFYISGNESKKVLIRAIGPGLTTYGVTGVLADPMLKIYDSKSVLIAANDNWSTQTAPATSAEVAAASTATGAFPLAAGSADAAIVLTLQPGAYSAIVTGAGTTTGSALLEIYEVPNP